jgi:hypothetical protein
MKPLVTDKLSYAEHETLRRWKGQHPNIHRYGEVRLYAIHFFVLRAAVAESVLRLATGSMTEGSEFESL